MYLGIDFGTSGCRACVIDDRYQIQGEARVEIPEPVEESGRIQQAPSMWLDALQQLLRQMSEKLDLLSIQRLAVDGTSGTVLLCDAQGQPLTRALMYNDTSSEQALAKLRIQNPNQTHICMSSSSGLAKAIALCERYPDDDLRILSQADFISNFLTGQWGFSDYHNALKLGYDCINQQWPDWVQQALPENALPQVFSPGQPLQTINPARAAQYELSPALTVCAGTTDGNASFIATGATCPGDAVTSLGSTLVLKTLSEQPIEDLSAGIYSHKMGHYWLVGGASNAGGKILKRYFNVQQIANYSKQMHPQQPGGLNYYPLSTTGERFPVNDPYKEPRLSPRPQSDVEFLQGILEGLGQIEKTGYEKLTELGAHKPRRVLTTGGGAHNRYWTKIRARLTGYDIKPAQNTEASYGSALLALKGLRDYL